MKTCTRCGANFDLTRAKRRIGHLYGAETYDRYYSNGDICDKCAIEEISADYGAGEEELENMGSGWDD